MKQTAALLCIACSIVTIAAAAPCSQSDKKAQDSLINCLRGNNVTVITASDAQYDSARQVYNKRFDASPLAIVYARNAEIRGTMNGFGYGYLADKLGQDASDALPLQGPEAYEALNLVNGRRSVAEIREWLLAEFGKSDAQALVIYLQALEKIGVIRRAP